LKLSPRYGLATLGYMAVVFLLSSQDFVALTRSGAGHEAR